MRVLDRCCLILMCTVFMFSQTPIWAAKPKPQPASKQKAQETKTPLGVRQLSAKAASENKTTVKDLLSFDYIDADLPTVLKAIAASYDLNLILATDIKGKVTAQLKDISLDDALNAILRVNGYGFSRRDNIVYIVPQSDVDLVTEFIPLSFMLAKDAQGLLTRMISKRGALQINDATNTLIVTDVPEIIKDVKEMVKGIDQPPMQVLIEAKLVDMNTTDAQNIGTVLNATYSPTGSDLASATITSGGSTATTDTNTTTTITGSGSAGGVLQLIPRFKKFIDTDMTINMLVQQQRARVLAAPSIATLNGQEARIIIGNKYPYKESTVTNTTTTQSVKFIDVGTTLKVTPMISPDGWITMKVHPEVSSATPSTDGPVVSTREADATIRVRDNETIVIGGLISNVNTASQDGVPLLRSIPILGWFFKQHVSNDVKSELMVFITPHIIRSPGQEAAFQVPEVSNGKIVKSDMPNEVRIDQAAVSPDSEMLTGLLSYVSDLESNADIKKSDNLYLKLELLKTYKTILKEFPLSGKSDYCLFKIANLYVKDFGKCGAAQEALAQLQDRFPQSSYIDAAQALVRGCPKEAFIIREDPPVKVLKK
ncbi:MAG: secretin and TonB N-terminal domain-containing protein [Candidatus Omnitrophica bacterium]|nr:secretin and TonB N-terminal domain-containing protein [Candidatus Omnitrophota bacterium]